MTGGGKGSPAPPRYALHHRQIGPGLVSFYCCNAPAGCSKHRSKQEAVKATGAQLTNCSTPPRITTQNIYLCNQFLAVLVLYNRHILTTLSSPLHLGRVAAAFSMPPTR
jgi:hypothetical protein